MNNFFNYQDRSELQAVLDTANGKRDADLLLTDAMVLDVVNATFRKTNIAITGRMIAGVGPEYKTAKEIKNYNGKYIVPGFINSHLHVESSLMHPFEFQKMTLPLGTTTAVCDPHEIVNVLGSTGLEWFFRCADLMQQNLYIQISSCVPALEGMETNGAQFSLEQMKQFIGKEHSLGMAEMMNFPGVINGFTDVLDKLETFQKAGMGVDGHCPLVRGCELDGYIAAGVRNCHETISADEALEKLSKGMSVMMREGSVAKNLHSLAPIITEANSMNILLCTDDRNPYDLLNEGELTYMLKVLINEFNVKPEIAYRMASYSAANHYGLHHLGMIAPGRQADLVVLNDLCQVDILTTFCKGQEVDAEKLEQDIATLLQQSNPPLSSSVLRDQVTATDFSYYMDKAEHHLIGVVPEEIITEKLTTHWDGQNFDQDDVLQIAVVERHGNGNPISLGLVKGFGLTRGAIASTVAHDSHNIIVVGKSPAEMAIAVNRLIESAGGFVVVKDDQILAHLALPLAGLMSLESAQNIFDKIQELKGAARELGCSLEEPFLQLSFLALPVIPALKITDKGLFDVTTFSYLEK